VDNHERVPNQQLNLGGVVNLPLDMVDSGAFRLDGNLGTALDKNLVVWEKF